MPEFPDLVAPYQRVPLVHDTTDLFDPETMTALDGRYVAGGGGVATGGTTGQVYTKDSGTDFDASWQTPTSGPAADASGAANNPHTTKGASRNASLPKNFWQYTGVAGVDDPTNWIAGDEWITV